MPVMGADLFLRVLGGRRFVQLELFRGLAQRTKRRKTSYLDAPPIPAQPTTRGKIGRSARRHRPNFAAQNSANPRAVRAAGLGTIGDGNETIFTNRRNQPETYRGYTGNQQTALKTPRRLP